MPLLIDLHTHSTCSDGSLTPQQLVQEAVRCGLAAIALTDHDTMAGVAEARGAGQELGIEVLAGIEISANHDNQAMHILGYGADPGHPGLRDLIVELGFIRQQRNTAILDRLDSLGFTLSREELATSATGLIGRPHIARQLMLQGHVGSINQAFQKFLKKSGRAYVPADKFPASETIKIIREAGGVAVLAHPTSLDKNLKGVPALVAKLVDCGLGGIEVYYPGHSRHICQTLLALATRYHLAVTGGSDYHGSLKPGISLGGAPVMPAIPYQFLEELKAQLEEPITAGSV